MRRRRSEFADGPKWRQKYFSLKACEVFSSPEHDHCVNPYETPRGIGEPRDIREHGVGVWRDRGLIVMHQRARLPQICIKTGVKADGAFPILIKGRELRVPLSDDCFFWFVLFWRRVAILAAIVLLLTGGWMAAFYSVAWELIGLAAMIAAVTIAFGWVALTAPTKILRCVRTEQDYLWLAGAEDSFLSQLPPWPAQYS